MLVVVVDGVQPSGQSSAVNEPGGVGTVGRGGQVLVSSTGYWAMIRPSCWSTWENKARNRAAFLAVVGVGDEVEDLADRVVLGDEQFPGRLAAFVPGVALPDLQQLGVIQPQGVLVGDDFVVVAFPGQVAVAVAFNHVEDETEHGE
jgi:hypothetical protein